MGDSSGSWQPTLFLYKAPCERGEQVGDSSGSWQPTLFLYKAPCERGEQVGDSSGSWQEDLLQAHQVHDQLSSYKSLKLSLILATFAVLSLRQYFTLRQRDNVSRFTWQTTIQNLFAPRSQNGDSTQYLAVIWQVTICWLKAASHSRNRCRVCPALMFCVPYLTNLLRLSLYSLFLNKYANNFPSKRIMN